MVETFLRVVLGIVLAGAALAKLASPRASIAAMASFGFEGGPLRPIAWAGLIAVELGLGVAVALGSDSAA
ncbi:MAG TPA: DoxX family membrane protein, partial [Solirubrobacterales bacterium]|nr:DoxX family membrane protein [Solirubrobacterales bacterium]